MVWPIPGFRFTHRFTLPQASNKDKTPVTIRITAYFGGGTNDVEAEIRIFFEIWPVPLSDSLPGIDDGGPLSRWGVADVCLAPCALKGQEISARAF